MSLREADGAKAIKAGVPMAGPSLNLPYLDGNVKIWESDTLGERVSQM